MNERLVRDLGRHAFNKCWDVIDRTVDLASLPEERVSITMTVGICIVNQLLADMKESGAPDHFIDQMIDNLRKSITLDARDFEFYIKDKSNV